jgi:hypothetical protein
MDRQDLLDQSTPLLMLSLSNSGKLKINKIIQNKVNILKERYGLEEDEILNSLFERFLECEIYQKYDPEKALSTFIVYCTHYNLYRELRKQRTSAKNYPDVPFDDVSPERNNGDSNSSLPYLKNLGIDGLFEKTTPEDICIGKELLGLIMEHYGNDDAKVILGISDRKDMAEQLSMKYWSYCKRLNRKTKAFKPILQKHGYSS